MLPRASSAAAPSLRDRWRARLPGWMGGAAAASEVCALALGTRCLMVRVQHDAAGGAPHLVDADEADPTLLRRWRDDGRLPRRGALLVLRGGDRHSMVMERPPVPDAELPLAVRFPLAEAMEIEPEALLATAVPLPAINDGARPQMLGVGGRLEAARTQLHTLAAAGVQVRSIDVMDSALRGMALLQQRADGNAGSDGWIVPAIIGRELCIGLVWQGRIAALRTLALPERAPRDEGEYLDQLALHIQRTADLIERQATRLAVRHVLVSLPGLPPGGSEQVGAALPLAARSFHTSSVMALGADLQARLDAHPDLVPLACVAAARLLDAAAAAPQAAREAAA